MKVYAHHAIRKHLASLLLCSLYSLSTARLAEAMVLDHLVLSQTGLQAQSVLKSTMEDVKKSGYYYMVCDNIMEAWRLCDPNAEHNEDELIPEYKNCEEETNDFEEKRC